MLTIYTHSRSPFHREFWKYLARRILRKYSGPDAVLDSLRRGMIEVGETFILNPNRPGENKVLVLSGTSVLRTMIEHKKAGRITLLAAGPNIVTHPNEEDRLLCDKSIDIVLVPSEWVADLWRIGAPELAHRIRVWPAGVKPSSASRRTGLPIIYDKIGAHNSLFDIQRVIGEHRLFTYGKFKRQEYLKALADAPYLIYLSPSESQGLALQEAWAHDVPTLVKHSTKWQHGKRTWEAPKINCPYLTPELGMVFSTTGELPIMVSEVETLHPKEYCDQNLSDQASARILLSYL